MRKFLFLVALSGLVGCSAPRMYYDVSINYVDYREFTDSGFFITESNSVGFDYKPISSVIAIAKSGYLPNNNQRDLRDSKIQDDVYHRPVQTKSDYKIATPNDAVKELVDQAKRYGANGIINLVISNDTGSDHIVTFSATGMAILK